MKSKVDVSHRHFLSFIGQKDVEKVSRLVFCCRVIPPKIVDLLNKLHHYIYTVLFRKDVTRVSLCLVLVNCQCQVPLVSLKNICKKI